MKGKSKDIDIKIKKSAENISNNIKNIDNIVSNHHIINNGDLINQANINNVKKKPKINTSKNTNIKKSVKKTPEITTSNSNIKNIDNIGSNYYTSNSNIINNDVSFKGYIKVPEINLNEFSFRGVANAQQKPGITANAEQKHEITTSSKNTINNISFSKGQDNSIKTNKGSNIKKSIDKSSIKANIVDYFSPINQGNTVKTSKRINMKKSEKDMEHINNNIESFKNSLEKAVLKNYKNFDTLVGFFSFFVKNCDIEDYYSKSMSMEAFVQNVLLNNTKDGKTIDTACNQVLCDGLINFLKMQNVAKSINTDILEKYLINLATLVKKLKKTNSFANILRAYCYILPSNKIFLADINESSKEIVDVLKGLATTLHKHNTMIDKEICQTLFDSVIDVFDNKIYSKKGIKKVKSFVKQIDTLLSKLEKVIEKVNCHKEGFNQQIANCIQKFASSVRNENDLENFTSFTSSLEKYLYTLLAMKDSKERENVLNRMLDMIFHGMSSFDGKEIANEFVCTKNGSVSTKNGSMNIFGNNISTIVAKKKYLSISGNSKREFKKIIGAMHNKKSSSNSIGQKKKKGIYCCGNIFSKCFGK